MSELAMRVKTPDAVVELFRSAVKANELVFETLAQVDNFIAGNNPSTQDALGEQGRSEASNVNFGEAEGLCDDAVNVIWNRHSAEPNLLRVEIVEGEDAVSRAYAGEVIADLVSRALRASPQFQLLFREFISDYIRIGRAFFFFGDSKAVLPEVLNYSDLLLPEGYPVDASKWGTFFVRRFESVGRLYSLVRDEDSKEVARQAGYDVTEIQRLLFSKLAVAKTEEEAKVKAHLVNNFQDTHPVFVEFWGGFENNTLHGEFLDSEKIPVVYHLVHELEGTWSVRAVAVAEGGAPFAGEKHKFYFSSAIHAKSIYEILAPAFHRPRKQARSSRSLIHSCFNELTTNNEILNSIVDFLPWLTSAIASGGDETKPVVVRNKANLITLENGALDATAMQAMRGSAAVEVYRILAGVMERKRKHSPSGMGSNVGSVQPLSREEVSRLSEQVSDAQIAMVQLFDIQVQPALEQIFRRFFSVGAEDPVFAVAHKLVKTALKQHGIPLNLVDSARVFCAPSIGYGNLSARAAAVVDVIKNVDLLGIDAYGKQRLARMFLVTRLGSEFAREILPGAGPDRPTVSEQHAHFENLFLRAGQAVPVRVEDEHYSHFLVHYNEAAQPILNQVASQPQTDYVQAARILTVVQAHLVAHHERMPDGGSKKAAEQALKQIQQTLSQVSRAAEAQIAAQQQSAQEAAAREASEVELKAELEKYRIDLDHKVKMIDAENQNQIRLLKAEAKVLSDAIRNAGLTP